MDPATLPRPKLYANPPAGQQPQAFHGRADEQASGRPGKASAFVAVGLMILGVILVGLFVATVQWPLLVLGLLVGAGGAVLAVKVRIMEDVSVAD